MKRANRAESKEAVLPSQLNSAPKTANVKDHDNVSRKHQAPKYLRGPTSKYGQHNDLKEQNRMLEAGNEDLQRQLAEMKENVASLENQCKNVQAQKCETEKRLRDCHMLLVAESIDPVSGEKVGEAALQREGQRKELMDVSQNLLSELNKFNEMAVEHKAQLVEVQNTMADLREAREKLCRERDLFTLEVEEMENELGEAEKLLME